jgi:hypothetical protein
MMCKECGLIYEWHNPFNLPEEEPMNYPQYGYTQPQAPHAQQYGAPPPMSGAAAAVQAQAESQVWAEVASQPKRNPVNRDRIDDGTHHIHLDKVYLKPSSKDGRLMLMWEFTVVASTVPQCVGRNYGFPMFFSNRMQLLDLSDVAKDIWGEEQVRSWATSSHPSDVAAYIGNTVTGQFCVLTARRGMKDGATYETAFVNHTFRTFAQSQQQLPALPQQAAPQFATQPGMPQQPQGFPQPPQQPGFPPGMPQQPQGFPQPPQQPGFPPGMPQQPQGFPQPPQQPGFPPGMPQQPQGFPQPPQQPQQPGFPPGMPQQPQGFPQQPGFPPPQTRG